MPVRFWPLWTTSTRIATSDSLIYPPTNTPPLRRLRTDFKQINDKAYRKTVRSDRNRRQTIIKILSGDSFDSNAARDYVESRYLSSMDYAVDEMEIQYRLYHLLNPRQRQQWLSSCLR